MATNNKIQLIVYAYKTHSNIEAAEDALTIRVMATDAY